MSPYVSARAGLVDLCLSQIEIALLREELDRVQGSGGRPEFHVPAQGIDSSSFRLRGLRLQDSAPTRNVLDARRAACAIERLTEENGRLRENVGFFSGLAIAAGTVLLLIVLNVLSNSD